MEAAIWGKKFLLFYMASFRTFRIAFHTFRTAWDILTSLNIVRRTYPNNIILIMIIQIILFS